MLGEQSIKGTKDRLHDNFEQESLKYHILSNVESEMTKDKEFFEGL